MKGLAFDVSHLLAGGLVLISFLLIYQTRLYALLNVFAAQAVVLSMSVAWQAYVQDANHLYLTALIAFAFKALVIPVVLHRIIAELGIRRDVENVVGVGLTMLAGLALVALSEVVMLRVASEADALAREDLAFALSVVLLGMLMMVVRRNAVSMVVGFMSLGKRAHPRGDRGQGHAARGRDISRLLGAGCAGRDRRLPVPHQRAVRDGRRARARPLSRRSTMTGYPNAAIVILALPAATAAILAMLPSYRLSAALNVASAFVTFLASVSLLAVPPPPGAYILVDELNVVFIVLNTFVGFTASKFSGDLYRARDRDRTADADASAFLPRDVSVSVVFDEPRARRQQYRVDVGGDRNWRRWTTVLMVGIYRTPESGSEAAWKYFILGSVGTRTGAVRFDPCVYGRTPGGRRGRSGNAVDDPDRSCARVRASAAQPRLCASAARLRDEGRARPIACLAARRTRRRADADLGRALGPAPQCGRSLRRFAICCCSTPMRAPSRRGR